MPERMPGVANKRTGSGKGEIRGSFHCAVHDETVNYLGRDDGFS
jgi:hypothetical protein